MQELTALISSTIHNPDVITALFWGIIGLGIISPVLFLNATYQATRHANVYHFRGYYRLKRQYHLNQSVAYGFGVVVSIGVLAILFL